MNLLKIFLTSLFAITATRLAFAACTINGQVVPCDQIPKAFLLFPIIMLVVAVLGFYFWIKMLLHAIKTENENKVVWILVIVLLQFLGAIIYYFARKRPEDKLSGEKAQPLQPNQNTAASENAVDKKTHFKKSSSPTKFCGHKIAGFLFSL